MEEKKFLLLHKMLSEKIRNSIRRETQELLNVAEEIHLTALSNKKMELTIYGQNHHLIKKVIYHSA